MARTRAFIIYLFLLLGVVSNGSPARKGVFLLTQPDGTMFSASLNGDEFNRILTASDGCAIERADNGFYQYVSFNPDGSARLSGCNVGDEDTPEAVKSESRNIPRKALSQKAMTLREMRMMNLPIVSTRADARSGVIKKSCVVILVQFPDLKFQNPETRRQEFEDLVTEKGYSKDGSNGSVLDYLDAQFNGSYEFSFTVSEIVTASRNHDYYGENLSNGNDSRPEELVKEACALSDSSIDFSQFDADGDGTVDNVFVIVAGKSEAEGGGSDCIWPHQWYITNDFSLDGKKIRGYTMSAELSVQSQKSNGQLIWGMARIGTFCHEYCHTLGLPDLYDTDGAGSGGTSDALWFQTSLMDGGSYNNNGKTPPNLNALEREILAIGDRETLRTGRLVLEPVEKNGSYLILENPVDKSEFYLFECRTQSGWDAFIGGKGLAIYHIDMTSRQAGHSDYANADITALYRWRINEINCNPSFQCADMIETQAKAIDVSQAFRPFGNKASFSASTDPSFTFNDGAKASFSITNISLSGDNVSFNVLNSSEALPKPAGLTAEIYQDAVILKWEADLENVLDTTVVSWGETSKRKATVKVVPYEPSKYALTLEGLSPTTSYSLSLSFSDGGVTGEAVEYDFLTKSRQNGKRAFIYLDYLSDSRSGGKFKAGTGLPLRLFNAIGENVEWFFDGERITTGADGSYRVTKSGTLKAVISKEDGSKEIIVKEITVI